LHITIHHRNFFAAFKMTSKVHQVQRLFRARNTRAPGPSRDLVAAVGEADGLGVVGLSREMMGELFRFFSPETV
jgi:hypothetical protein